jgi:protocatechuate 3,4-dioxygenase, beta subunit
MNRGDGMSETPLKTTIGEIVRGNREFFPPFLYDAYRSTVLRAPKQPMIDIPLTITELTGPGPIISRLTPEDADLTRNAGTNEDALGQRIIVTGHVYDRNGDPIPNTLIEVWQANSAGRYLHRSDSWPAPLDPNFLGIGRCLTDGDGAYRFLSIRPGAYPWKNHPNAWRPAHIHFSLFGPNAQSRLITQMYFPDDPLHELDPILQAVPRSAQSLLIADYDQDVTTPEWALGYRFNIVLNGENATPFENAKQTEGS